MAIDFNNISMDQIRLEVFKRTGVSIDTDDPFFVAIKLLLFAAQTLEEQVAETTNGLKKVTEDARLAIKRIPRSAESSYSTRQEPVIVKRETPEMAALRKRLELDTKESKEEAAWLAAKCVSERLADEIPKYYFWTETRREVAKQFDVIAQEVAQQFYEKVRRLVVCAAVATCACTTIAVWIFSK